MRCSSASMENTVPALSLPVVAQDVTALRNVLIHPERCAYPEQNVQVLVGKQATRQGILDGLHWLQEKIQADASANTTAILYYSGHGWQDGSAGQVAYYLIPYDMRQTNPRLQALAAADFAGVLSDLNPTRLVVILDCCHAGGMDAK